MSFFLSSYVRRGVCFCETEASVPCPVIQGDGDILSVQQHGDEYSHYAETRDGSGVIYVCFSVGGAVISQSLRCARVSMERNFPCKARRKWRSIP